MKLMKEDKNCYHFSKGGKVIKVAKNGVGKKIKGYAEGGLVENPDNIQPSPTDPVEIDGHQVARMADDKGLSPSQKRAALQLYYMESYGGKAKNIEKPNNVGAQGGFQVTAPTLDTLKKAGFSRNDLDLSNPRDAVEAGLDNIKYLSSQKKIGDDANKIRAAHLGGPGVVSNSGIEDRQDNLGTSTKTYADPNSNRVMMADQYANQYMNTPYASSFEKPFYQRPELKPGFDPQSLNFDPQGPAIFAGTQYPQNNPQYDVEKMSQNPTARDADAGKSFYAAFGPDQGASAPPEAVPPYKLAAQKNQQMIEQANQSGAGIMPASAPTQQSQLQPYGMNSNPFQEIYDQKSNALNVQAGAEEKQRQAEQQYAQTVAKQQQDMVNRQNQILSESNQQIDKFTQDYMDKKIDPNRVFNNASTGRMFSGAIGLMLSGIGSALTGQPSQALMVIDRAIDRDIESQKMEIGKGKTLLDLQLQKYGNERDAVQATRIYLGAQALAEMEKAKAMARKPEIQAALQTNQANLKLALVQQQADLKNRLLNFQASTGASRLKEGSPEYYFALNNNPNLTEKMYVDDNKDVYFAKDPERSKKVDSYMTNFNDLDRSLEDLKQFDTVSARIPLTEERRKAATAFGFAIKNFMSNESAKVGSTRLSELEHEISKQVLQDPTKFSTTYLKSQVDEIKKSLQKEKENFLKNNLIGYQPKSNEEDRAKQQGFIRAK